MKKQFKFKLGGIYLDKDNTVFTAKLNENNIYKIRWTKANGDVGTNGYIKEDVEEYVRNGKWIIIKDKKNTKFTVTYNNSVMKINGSKEFNKKKDALYFMDAIEDLFEIKDVKLFKTKETLIQEENHTT